MAAMRTLGLILALVVAPLAAAAQPYLTKAPLQTGEAGRIQVLSSRADMVTGGDALVEISAPAAVSIRLNGRSIDRAFQRASGGALVGLVRGLKPGDNLVEVSRPGAATARMTLTNWPSQGPVFAGPKEAPFLCQTEAFKLPVTGGTLGPAISADCEARTRVDYVYRTKGGDLRPLPKLAQLPADVDEFTDRTGSRRPFVIRIETGVVNRSIYQIAMPHDPRSAAPGPLARSAGWNGGLIYTFGGGCPGGMYVQGRTTGGVLDEQMLARGYAVASSSLNVFANNCDDLLASETMMMVKERFVERFGAPRLTIGWGCSGGSYQAEQIGDNYPGLLDGIVVGCSFPDVAHAAVSVHSFGAKLVFNYYRNNAKVPWSEAQIVAASGLPDYTSLVTQGDRGDRMDPKGVCPPIPKDQLYDPEKNPRGARCSIYDHGVNAYGRDALTGFARRPLDNVGVQYGLVALNAGVITTAQFIDLNSRIGGLDIDSRFTPQRTVADREALRRAYASGRILSGGNGLAALPIIDYRAYADFDKGDPHQRFHSFSFRARLEQANGNADNQVLLTESARYGLFSLQSPVLQGALDAMDVWVRRIQADQSSRPQPMKVVAAKPPELVDACFTQGGEKLAERQVWGQDTRCNRLYPPHANPYIAAGGPLANNVAKCQLKPLTPADYRVRFTASEWGRLQATFPDGVCDYGRPGVEQERPTGVWLSFGPAGAPPPSP